MVSKVAPELKRRSKSYGDLKLKRTFDLYKQEQEHTSSITTAPHIRRRRHSSFSDYKYDLKPFQQQQQQHNNSDSTLQKDTKTITLHESFLPKKLENKIKYNEVVEQSKILPTMELPTTTTTTTATAKQRSKGIVSAIIDVAKCPEKESLGWVGIEEQHESDIHDTASITLSTTPPPPPPIENDTHIFDLLSKNNAYFIHYSKKNDNLTSSMNSATVEKLVEIITKDIDTDLLMDFFLTFRQFLTPIKLCKLLILRFRWALLNNDDDRRLVRIRTFVVIRYWLTHYWEHDFMTSRTLRFMLCTFLSQLRSHPTILNSPRDENIIRNLRNVLKRQRKLYCSQLDHSVTRTTTATTNNTNTPPLPIILDNHQSYLYNKHPLISETNWHWQPSTYHELQQQGNNNNNNNNNNNIHKIPLAVLNCQRKHRQGTSKSDGDIDNQLFRQWKEVRTSTSSSSLPFIGNRRARRHSTCSQRSVYSENAWSAKMNFNIKKIKRSVPTVYQSILQGMTTTPHPSSIDYFQQQQQSYDFISEKCLCEKKIKNNSNNQRYRSLSNRSTPSLMKSASRFFDFKKTASSQAKKQTITTTASPFHLPTCPFYTTELSTTINDNIYPSTSTSSSSAMEGAPSLSSSSSSSTTTTTANVNHQRFKSYSSSIKSNHQHHHLQQQHRHLLPRASFYSDAPPPSITIGADTPLLLRTDYKSFILHYRSEIIAQQFCIMEQRMLQLVTWNELAELRWRKKSKGKVISPDVDNDIIRDGVEQLIGFFNKTCQWVASEIVRTRNMDTRVRVIEKFIRIALKCYHHRNYSTLMQMLLGLQSPAVSRLEKTWQRVDHYEMQIFGELKELAKPFRNWKNIRDAMTKATEDISESSAVDSILIKKRHQQLLLLQQQQQQHHHLSTDSQIPFLSSSPDSISGCIPFLGLYLSDLVFNAELPTYIDTSKLENREPFGETLEDKELCKRLGTHLVNYNKFRITASIIKHILAFQVLCRTYHFDYHEEIAMNLKKMQLLDNSEIRKQSSLCEPGPL